MIILQRWSDRIPSYARTSIMDMRALNIAFKGLALSMVIPDPSDMSTSSSRILSHSKHWIKEANANPTTLLARPAPGHDLLPTPNGVNFKPTKDCTEISWGQGAATLPNRRNRHQKTFGYIELFKKHSIARCREVL